MVKRLIFAAALAVPFAAAAAESAATFYALNCMGCHPPPEAAKRAAQPLRGQFAHSEAGRVFFISMPAGGAEKLSPAEDAQLMREILTWKRSCSVVLQQAHAVRYRGEKSVR